MPDLRPNSAYSSQPDVALIHTVYGEPVDQTVRPNNTDEGVTSSVGSLYRPYKKPQRTRNGHAVCATDGCRAYPSKGTGHCIGHARKLGLVENWNQEGRKTHEPE
jgi:hypothetical protein